MSVASGEAESSGRPLFSGMRGHDGRDGASAAPLTGRSAEVRLQRAERRRWFFFCAILVIILLFGGASRADSASQIVVRLAAIAGASLWALRIDSGQLRSVRAPLLMVGATVLLIAIHLVPVPASIWLQLPGRGIFAEGYHLAGVSPSWHSLTLTPDRALNSLLALLPPIAIILGMATLERQRHRQIGYVILIVAAIGALIAAAQISIGQLYLYRVTNVGSAVGLFANRNHQALLLAIVFPVFSAIIASDGQEKPSSIKLWFGLCFGAAMAPLLLLTGSRAGIAFAVIGMVLALLIPGRRAYGMLKGRGIQRGWIVLLPIALGAIFVFFTIFISRDEALQRLLGVDPSQELRITYLPIYLKMIADFFPVGSGIGSFEPLFQIYEPTDTISYLYLNHAHNDFFEILIEGGLPAAIGMAAAALWIVVGSARAWLAPPSPDRILARAGSAIVWLCLISSALDYPLRTPALSTLFAIALVWMFNLSDPGARWGGKKELAAGQDFDYGTLGSQH